MMHVMKFRILLIAPLQRIPRQAIATMIIDALHDGEGAEAHGLTNREAGEGEGEGGADGVEEEGFGEGIVEGAKGVRDVDLMVLGVHFACEGEGVGFGKLSMKGKERKGKEWRD